MRGKTGIAAGTAGYCNRLVEVTCEGQLYGRHSSNDLILKRHGRVLIRFSVYHLLIVND